MKIILLRLKSVRDHPEAEKVAEFLRHLLPPTNSLFSAKCFCMTDISFSFFVQYRGLLFFLADLGGFHERAAYYDP